ncbi:nitrous oxide reductase accessory protein NosL [Pseudomonas sp. A3.4]|nr:nitrous oxide reductase accessory protein NosL [Atopomonas sediminilitoris]MCJ8168142.1 nitrous oxide reductase accessory protein NosL [Atopomonas sediminilitoris]
MAAALLLSGCEQASTEVAKAEPVAFHTGDECHVCGMAITDFPGPKGEALHPKTPVKKFCSSAELLGWWLQPENQTQPYSLFVHDMARGDWQHPDDRHLIDAKTAYYVVAPSMPGAMGVTIATFAEQADAQQLAEKIGSTVSRLEHFTLENLHSLAQSSQHGGHDAHSMHGSQPAGAMSHAAGVDQAVPDQSMPEQGMPAHDTPPAHSPAR